MHNNNNSSHMVIQVVIMLLHNVAIFLEWIRWTWTPHHHHHHQRHSKWASRCARKRAAVGLPTSATTTANGHLIRRRRFLHLIRFSSRLTLLCRWTVVVVSQVSPTIITITPTSTHH